MLSLPKTLELQKKKGVMVKKSWRIQEKANALSRLIGSGEQIEEERKVKTMMTLKECAARKLKSSSKINAQTLPKIKLNTLYATLLYPEMHDQWVHNSPFANEVEIANVCSTTLFSYPGYSDKRQTYEPMCVDAHHLLVNLRVKVCKDGLTGIRKEAWHKVAEEDRNIISKALVVDLLNKQNSGYAQRTFSKEVELKMTEMGYDNEAAFCNIVREWYEAEDFPGISAIDRACRRLRMKACLLRNIDFGIFPPYGMYINGFTRISFEGFLQKIDTNIQLYALSPHRTYNQRSISSLADETFFGELSEMEATKLGCPETISIPRLISTVTEILHYRCDPSDRAFSISTTRKSVYPVHSLESSEIEEPFDATDNVLTHGIGQVQIIKLRDHFFDTPLRKRRKQRISKKYDVSKPNEVSRGCLPVRQHHKTDESKILPTTRLGIELTDYCDI